MTVDVQESHVSVLFKPSDSHYGFGRLAGIVPATVELGKEALPTLSR